VETAVVVVIVVVGRANYKFRLTCIPVSCEYATAAVMEEDKEGEDGERERERVGPISTYVRPNR
jgi:hypothetical protein